MDARDLARLAHLVEARKAGALARLEALTAEMRTCEDEIVAPARGVQRKNRTLV